MRDDEAVAMSSFKANKLDEDSSKNWDRFYMRNGTRFYKDRHWIKDELQAICPDFDFQSEKILFEIGCGVGNFLFPFLEYFPLWKAFACDCSRRAIDLVKQHGAFDEARCTPFVADVSADAADTRVEAVVGADSTDLCTLVFVLSTLTPARLPCALRRLWRVSKPGALVFVRDYGLHDHAMNRFSPRNRIERHFYARQDGTRAYYFSEEQLVSLFEGAGFVAVSCRPVQRVTLNKKEQLSAERVFVQGLFRKPPDNHN